MKVVCKAAVLSDEQRHRIGGMLAERNSWAIDAGENYLVLGLTFAFGSSHLGSGGWIEYENPRQGEYILTAPLVLFDVVDHNPSALWELRLDGDVAMLWPSEFFRPGFHDRLSDGRADEVRTFRRVKESLEGERAR